MKLNRNNTRFKTEYIKKDKSIGIYDYVVDQCSKEDGAYVIKYLYEHNKITVIASFNANADYKIYDWLENHLSENKEIIIEQSNHEGVDIATKN